MIPLGDLNRVVQCVGSHVSEKKYERVAMTDSQREGRTAHWLIDRLTESPDTHFDFDDQGNEITEEMRDAAELWFREAGLKPNPINIEVGEVRGKLDHVGINGDSLTIFNFHFGHKYINVRDDYRLIFGAIVTLSETGVCDKVTNIHLGIVQPRVFCKEGSVRSYTLTRSELEQYRQPLINLINLDFKEGKNQTTGPECLNCLHRVNCEGLTSSVSGILEYIKGDPIEWRFSTVEEKANQMSLLTKCAELLKSRLSGLEQELLTKALTGTRIPGYTLEASQGREYWKAPVDEVKNTALLFGANVVKETLITPKQAIKAGMDADIVKNLIETKTGAAKLVPSDNVIKRYYK
jgi:hypothetical protein